MTQKDNLKRGFEFYIKFLVIFLLCFIPFRNLLELYLGTIIKILPDVMILTLFVWYFILKKGKITFEINDVFLGMFLLLAFFNTVIIHKISLGIYIFEVRTMILYYIMYYVLRNSEVSEEVIVLFTKTIQVITYILCVLGIIEKLGAKTVLFPEQIADTIIYADNFSRVYSMFFNPNTYGAFLVLSFFLVIYYNEGKKLWLYKITVFFSLFMTMSRSSLLIMIFALAVYVLIIRKDDFRKRKKEVLLQFVLVFLLSTVMYITCEKAAAFIADYCESIAESNSYTTMFDRMKELQGDEIIEQSNAVGRLFFVKTGLEVFQDYPVMGTGFGTYGSAASMKWEPPFYSKYSLPKGFYSDNEYIKDLVQTGIIGCLILFIFLGSTLYLNRKNAFNLLICIIVGWLGLFYNVFEVQIISFLLWICLAIFKKNDRKTKRIS